MRGKLGVLGGEKDAGQAAMRVGRSTSLLPLGPVTPGERERKPATAWEGWWGSRVRVQLDSEKEGEGNSC